MKKFIALLMALVMVFAFTACNEDSGSGSGGSGNSGGSDRNDRSNKQNDDPVSSFISIMQSGKFSIDFSIEDAGIEFKMSLAMDGDSIAVTFDDDILGFGWMLGLDISSIRIIIKSGMAYVVFDELEMYMGDSIEEMGMEGFLEEMMLDFFNGVNLQKTGDGEAMLNGKMTSYEDYKDSDGEISRFFVDGGKVVAMGSPDVDEVMIITKMSATIPAGTFDVPAGYINMME